MKGRATRMVMVIALLALPAAPGFAAAPRVGDDVSRQARNLRRDGDWAAAASLLETALRADPERSDRAKLQVVLGLCFMDGGRLDEAERMAEALARASSADARVLAARVHAARGRLDQALDSAREALDLKSDSAEALEVMVELRLQQGKPGAALKHAQHLEGLRGERGARVMARVLTAQGDAYRAHGPETLGLAVERYALAYERTPDDLELVRTYLEALILAVDLEEAERVVEAAFDGSDPALVAEGWTLRGRIRLAGQDAAGAGEAFARALETDPSHGPAALEQARLAFDAGRWDEAERHLATARVALGSSVRLCVVAGELAAAKGQLELAEQELRRAVLLDGDHPKALYHLGRVLMQRGRREEARAVLARFEETQRRNVQAAAAPVAEGR